MKNKEFFWVTNASNRNVSLSDLNLTIKAFTSVNLLDNKHYSYTKEQLVNSAKTGSLFKKSDKLFVRKVAPESSKTEMLISRENVIPSRERSVFIIKEDKYEELNVSDEIFASENADTAEMDTKPLITKV